MSADTFKPSPAIEVESLAAAVEPLNENATGANAKRVSAPSEPVPAKKTGRRTYSDGAVFDEALKKLQQSMYQHLRSNR